MIKKYLKPNWGNATKKKRVSAIDIFRLSFGRLFSSEFLVFIAVALIIALPLLLGWYTLNKWLENFDYHIKLEWWMFALAGLGDVLITILLLLPYFKRKNKKPGKNMFK
jgi:hypothetical protein